MAEAALDLSRPSTVHVVGVGGAGMSGIATLLARRGHRVSGSDLRESAALDRLRLLGVEAHVGHDPANVPDGAEAVVISTAIADANTEVREARRRGVPVLRRAEMLAVLTRQARTIAVSGTHGKTTTSSILALVLREAGWRPSFLIGGDVNEVGGNAVHDEGEWLVVEADESDGTFLELDAEAVIVTNVEPDHLEHYGDFGNLVDAFHRFVAGAAGPAVVTADGPERAGLVTAGRSPVTFGTAEDADYRLHAYVAQPGGSQFSVTGPEGDLGSFDLPVPGRHNALNALAALALAVELGARPEAARAAFARFTGVSRRFQVRGHLDGVTVVDDYAHLPSEVRAAIEAAAEGGFARVVVVFQPHRFSRTQQLWRGFADAFEGADIVVITDVYAAGETPRPGVSGRLVLQAVADGRPDRRVLYLPHRDDIERSVRRLVRPGDVLLVLGAGDINAVIDSWLAPAVAS